MGRTKNDQLVKVETTCGSLLHELQMIWDEVGESDAERDILLLELERECLEVYRRKVDQASRSRAQLRQTIADSEAKLASICAAMGERPVLVIQQDQNVRTLKEELQAIQPQLEEMQRRKQERMDLFLDTLVKIEKISHELSTSNEGIYSNKILDETDLSLRSLEELQTNLQALQREKSDRLKLVMDYTDSLSSLCSVLGLDLKQIPQDVQPTLVDSELSTHIDSDSIERLSSAVYKLREVKKQRMQKLQDLATTMLELWNLMDTPLEEQQVFQNVTRNIAVSEDEVDEPGILSNDFLNYVEAEVVRLEEMKKSKMKDLVLKKRSELEDVLRKAHMVMDFDSSMEHLVSAIESGLVNLAALLEQLESQIATAKEDAFSRKEILDKVDKWLVACEEENWLEEYNRDGNRYNAGRGTHLTLKRAEKARATINKLPAMVDSLVAKTTSWERENNMEFIYDGVRLLSLLEEYTIMRGEKEQERQRQRDQKRLQGQLITEQEVLFGSKPSPSKQLSAKKMPRTSMGSANNRRLSLGGAMTQMQPHHLDLPSKSSVRRNAGSKGLDATGLPARKCAIPSNHLETDAPLTQKTPFSPVNSIKSSFASKSNSINLDESHNVPAKNCSYSTPVKGDCFVDQENRTPKGMQIPVSITPQSAMMVPMPIAATPASSAKQVKDMAPEMEPKIEYSFEERRLGFVLQHGNSPAA